jgi:hypothetical protein
MLIAQLTQEETHPPADVHAAVAQGGGQAHQPAARGPGRGYRGSGPVRSGRACSPTTLPVAS